MKKKEIIFIIIIAFNLNCLAQVIKTPNRPLTQWDDTSIYGAKYTWNLSRIVDMMQWIENNLNGCRDSVYVSELGKIYGELKTIHESRLNFSLLDGQINRLNDSIKESWKDFHVRTSPYLLIQKEILSQKPDDIDQLVLRGIQFREENKLDSAYQNFKNAYEKDSTRLNYYYLVIDTELELNNNTDKALYYVNKIINPKSDKKFVAFNPYEMRVGLYIKQNKFTLALDDLNLLLQKDSNDLNSLYVRAFVKSKLKDFSSSNSDYQLFLRKYRQKSFIVYADTARIINNIGWNYYFLKAYDLCVQYANKSLLLKANVANTLDTRGSGYFGLGEYEKCINDMTKAIGLDPDLANSYYIRGLSYLKLNKQDLAYLDLSTASELGVSEAADALKGLPPIQSNSETEDYKKFCNPKPANNKKRVKLDAYGLHLFFK